MEEGTLLSIDDFLFVCKTVHDLGFVKFKLTGGEPTLRSDICQLVEKLASLNLPDLSMISNGTTLETLAPALRSAGLKRLNITLNTLNEKKHKKINIGKYAPLESIVRGVDAAIDAGFKDIKLNFVHLGKDSDADMEDVLDFATQRGLTMVLLPIMPNNTDESAANLRNLRMKLEQLGINSVKKDVDLEGINRLFITMKSGAKILLRQDELGERVPYTFCANCHDKKRCKEGIFPLRVSAHGTLLPCLASKHNRIEMRPAIEARDKQSLVAGVEQIWRWQTGWK
ncbi:MAG: radical SAM protein [Spirochaetes bacterium]|nr:radical SAM protein [Spirochaetota bacterium]